MDANSRVETTTRVNSDVSKARAKTRTSPTSMADVASSSLAHSNPRGAINSLPPQNESLIGVVSPAISHVQSPDIIQKWNLPPRIPTAYKSLLAGAADQQFLGCFTVSYHNDALSPLISQFSSKPNFISASRAGTMAFYGKITTNIAIQYEARRWYEKAIQLQIARLRGNSDASQSLTLEDFLRIMMFCLFESALCTTPSGWIHHVGAIAKLLERVGPHACRTGPMHNVFLCARLNIVSAQVSWTCMRSHSQTLSYT
jgi:hypothetical protein